MLYNCAQGFTKAGRREATLTLILTLTLTQVGANIPSPISAPLGAAVLVWGALGTATRGRKENQHVFAQFPSGAKKRNIRSTPGC